jgi:hypothetical protein
MLHPKKTHEITEAERRELAELHAKFGDEKTPPDELSGICRRIEEIDESTGQINEADAPGVDY